MQQESDLKDIIEVLTIAISREESEEQFFRRSAEASTHEVACKTFQEIADEFTAHRKSMEARRDIIEQALAELKKE